MHPKNSFILATPGRSLWRLFKVTNVNSGAVEQNNTVSLGSYAPGANINVFWTVNIAPNDACFGAGDQCRVDFVANIYCTVIGSNLFNGFATGYISIALTKEKTTFDNGRGLCQSVPICANTSTPRSVINPINDFGDPCHPAHSCTSLAWRYNTSAPYQCFLNACLGSDDITPGLCTPN
jgi:hypothetical protein